MNTRDVMMMMAGGMLTLAYQKYNKPVMKTMKKTIDENMTNVKNKLEDMM